MTLAAALLAAAAAAATDGGTLSPVWERLLATLPKTVDLLAVVHRAAPGTLPAARHAVPCAARIRAAARACLDGRPLPPIGCSAGWSSGCECLVTM